MAGSHWNLRRVAARAALAGLAAFAAVSGANAQWFPPMGAASPGEIAQRLRAQGFVLIGPLRRNETVYLADVDAGASGHERLVIDAWSGEVLQRFVARPRTRNLGAAAGYTIERGEFDSPPPLGPPPTRDFFFGSSGGGVAYGGPPGAPVEATPRTRVNPRAAPIRRKPAESKPALTAAPPVQPATRPEGGANAAAKDNPGGIAPPSAAAAPTGAPSPGGEASQTGAPARPDASPAESPPAAAPDQIKETQPKPEGAAATPNVAQTQAKGEPQPARIEPQAPAPLAPPTKPGGKSKVNDVPVNPLE
jgi:hypothetical protein